MPLIDAQVAPAVAAPLMAAAARPADTAPSNAPPASFCVEMALCLLIEIASPSWDGCPVMGQLTDIHPHDIASQQLTYPNQQNSPH
jgi:hypothetical protein